MAKHRLATAALAVVALYVSPGSAPLARAQGAEEDEARAAFYKGRSLYKSGDYAQAAEMLQRAYELKPHPALLRYLGMTYYKMNKPHEAIKAFKRYIADAPNAPDRDTILARVRELEMVVGASDDEETRPAPTPRVAPAPTPTPVAPTRAAPAPSPVAPVAPSMAPTGEDDEMPDELGSAARRTGKDDSSSILSVLKWVSLGVGVGGLAAGAVFSGLAAGKASDLEQAVVDSNPTMNAPTVAYAREHHDLQEAFKRNRTAGIICWVVGGVASAAAATFFLLDRGGDKERAHSRVQVAPVIGGVYGVAGQVQF